VAVGAAKDPVAEIRTKSNFHDHVARESTAQDLGDQFDDAGQSVRAEPQYLTATVSRQWRFTRAWLFEELGNATEQSVQKS
jgi:hypothetical protein